MKKARRILVFAPHGDDELIGCGGTLACFVEAGAEVRVVVVFDGAAGDPEGRFAAEGYVAQREAEARRGGAHLGLRDYEFWRLPEGHTLADGQLEEYIPLVEQAAEEFKPDLVLVAWPGEAHPDHAGLARVIELWSKRARPSCEIWGYEVWSALAPDLLIDVAATWPLKLAALREHRTQSAYGDLAAWSKQNAFRRGALPVEAFMRLGEGAQGGLQENTHTQSIR
ncbi:MAG: PIG-L family deacetylase [bacterium]|nr:hypothetical protein [Planctomycetota bacterium]HIL52077.1 hypothetical protein [Planctomycetota bacterium]